MESLNDLCTYLGLRMVKVEKQKSKRQLACWMHAWTAQWRILFALSRSGGLRYPAEHLLLRWGDIESERNRMTVHRTKTEHHLGKESRVVPLFPELRECLTWPSRVAVRDCQVSREEFKPTHAVESENPPRWP